MVDGSEREAPPLTSVEFSENAPVAVGTGVWALLFVIGLFIRPDLAESGREWWIWSALAGIVIGLLGYVYLRRRRRRLLTNPRTPDPS